MQLKTFIIDAFTDKPFTGNPAGVCLMETPIDVKIMQSIASELNLSETAFLTKATDNNEQYQIRYFTPTQEIDFCGHATLASSKLVLDKLKQTQVEFITHKQLRISATKKGEYIKMNFPIFDTIDYAPNKDLLDAFGIEKPLSMRFCKNLDMLLIEVKDKQSLANISPNFSKAIESSSTIKELVITSISEDKEYDFYSRCFCPWIGINEDPVTGASHSVLAKYWGNKLEKSKMSAFQLSKRGGYMQLKILDATNLEVLSNAQIVFEGSINF